MELNSSSSEKSAENLLNLYIEACVEYYYKDNNIMSDAEYDALAAVLEKHYDKLPTWFKKLVPPDDFKGGGYVVGFKFGTGEWSIPDVSKG